MSSLLVDWCNFCEEKAYFDKAHFLSLFKDVSAVHNLDEIFNYFPNSDALVERAKNVLDAGSLDQRAYLFPMGKCSNADLLVFATRWLKEQSRFCQCMGDTELAWISSKASAVYVSNSVVNDAVQLDIPNNWIFDFIGDHVRNSKALDVNESYALFEALYGIAADYYLAWYIAAPLIDLDINLDLYFKLWKVGGVSVLLQDKLLVSSKI
ncbi:hypothetical protein ACFQNF_19985 [Iodobacter arcticus]|uniref:DUF2764 family protein n=1 Tax=Iodobacter arcticus TaxID=590593 RepID=A0ABW2R2K7_9NEIS